MPEWKKLGEKAKSIGFRTLVFKRFRLPDGNEEEFTTYGKAGSQEAAVIAITPGLEVIIARQFRPGPELVFDELPGGAADPGEDLEAAAKRELLEETGYKGERLEYIGKAHRDAYSNTTAHYYIAYNCVKAGNQQLDPGEFVEVNKISISQLLDNARKGKMTDAPAILLAYERLEEFSKA